MTDIQIRPISRHYGYLTPHLEVGDVIEVGEWEATIIVIDDKGNITHSDPRPRQTGQQPTS